MKKLKNIQSWFKKNTANARTSFKNRSQKFKEKIRNAENQPNSKRKSLLLGFTTILAITLIRAFPAAATETSKQLPEASKQLPKPNGIANPQVPAKSGTNVTALAIQSGAFALGGVCGFFVGLTIYGIILALEEHISLS